MEYICDGTRNSKWYYNGTQYVRKMTTRNGEKIKIYSHKDIKDLPVNPDEPSVVALKEHLNNLLTA